MNNLFLDFKLVTYNFLVLQSYLEGNYLVELVGN